MIIDFAKVDLNNPPVLLLCDADGKPMQYLGYAFNVDPELHYNETSSLSFDYPAFVDGEPTPGYDALVGMHEVLWNGVGYFILANPSETNDGIRRVKSCEAYSAEYEFTYKQITLEDGTYDFYDPIDNSNTVIGRIMELMPAWSIGSVDSALVGKYRTFDGVNDNVYNFIKSTIQDTYQCVFDFDILNRRVYVTSMATDVQTRAVYLSTQNLAKEIKLEEQTDDIFTCLDVSGADGIDIRSVNPLGTNKIYDLSYFMTEANVGSVMANKYQDWLSAYETSRLPYFNATVEMVLEQSRLETENAKLLSLQGERSTLDAQLSVYVEMDAQGVSGTSTEIAKLKSQISKKDEEIDIQEDLLVSVQDHINDLFGALSTINSQVAFSSFFTSDELSIVNKYIKEDSIQESSFVASEVSSYVASDQTYDVTSGSFSISDSSITKVTSSSAKEIYSGTGGSLQMSINGNVLLASIVHVSFELDENSNAFVFAAYLNDGTYNDLNGDVSEFPSGCVSMTGTAASIAFNGIDDSETGTWSDGTSVSSSSITGYWCLTENATEYQRRSIEWDLFDYGVEQLHKVSWPSYTFSVDSCNFLIPDEFIAFRNQLSLGKKIYLDINGSILEPILIGCSFSYEDIDSLKLEFGDKYNSKDARFSLTDLLDQSISSGKRADSNKYNYNSFVDSGASNSVLDFMKSALDASKNAVISGADQSIIFDKSGLRLRKADGNGGFLDEQIWMVNNNIVFTDDGWNSAKMAIGKIFDPTINSEGSAWGIAAPNLVGTMVAGNNLIITSAKQSGENAVFRVDANGAQLHNAKFDLISENGQIDLYPEIGLVGGSSSVSAPLFAFDQNGDISGIRTSAGEQLISVTDIDMDDLPNANFWLDMNGNAYLKGSIYATDGVFNGTVYATAGEFKGTVNAQNLQLDGINISNIFSAVGDGTFDSNGIQGLDYLQIGNIMIDGSTGAITWGEPPIKYQFSVNGKTNWHDEMESGDMYRRESLDGGATWAYTYQFRGEDGSDADVPRYIHSTYIGTTEIRSPEIKGNNVSVYGSFKALNGTGKIMGFMGAAYGEDVNGNTTTGVAIASSASIEGDSDDGISYATQGNYVIATSGGCRMQAGAKSLVVTSSTITAQDSDTGEVVNLLDGGGTAVFG